MNSTARFSNVADMADFCAGLTKAGIRYEVKAFDDASYFVTIMGF
jgi:hypothetical protein